MDTLIRARSSFWGRHTLKNHPDCGRDCGHTWTVTVTVAGEPDEERWMMPIDERKFDQEMFSIVSELRGKDIDKMVKPSLSTEMGIAQWFYGRLALRYDVREVTCWHDDRKMESILRVP
jgi:6-pyruvoyl-tetrahydropterin synthase